MKKKKPLIEIVDTQKSHPYGFLGAKTLEDAAKELYGKPIDQLPNDLIARLNQLYMNPLIILRANPDFPYDNSAKFKKKLAHYIALIISDMRRLVDDYKTMTLRLDAINKRDKMIERKIDIIMDHLGIDRSEELAAIERSIYHPKKERVTMDFDHDEDEMTVAGSDATLTFPPDELGPHSIEMTFETKLTDKDQMVVREVFKSILGEDTDIKIKSGVTSADTEDDDSEDEDDTNIDNIISREPDKCDSDESVSNSTSITGEGCSNPHEDACKDDLLLRLRHTKGTIVKITNNAMKKHIIRWTIGSKLLQELQFLYDQAKSEIKTGETTATLKETNKHFDQLKKWSLTPDVTCFEGTFYNFCDSIRDYIKNVKANK